MTNPRPPRPFQPDDLFYRLIQEVHIDKKRNRISPGAFANTSNTERMSVDWAHLSTAEESMARWHNARAVGQFVQRDVTTLLADLRADLQQQYEYAPELANPAHCNVVGPKPESVKKRLARATQIVLWPGGWTIPHEPKAMP